MARFRHACLRIASLAVVGQCLAVGLLLPAPAYGQEATSKLVGRVIDRSGDQPAVAAELVVLDTKRRTLTDAAGWYTLSDLPTGLYTIQISYLGFDPIRFVVRLDGGTTRLDFEIDVPPFELEEIRVEGQSGRYNMAAKRERRRAEGRGIFIDREDIAKSSTTAVSELLRRMPGIRIGFDRTINRLSIRMGYGLHACTPDLYVDGTRSNLDRMNDYTPVLIEAIEIYKRPIDRPPQYHSPDCGAILIWLRDRL